MMADIEGEFAQMRLPLFTKISLGTIISLVSSSLLMAANADSAKIELDKLPILGFVNLGTTTFGQVASELASKKCSMVFWPKSMLTNMGCLNLPGKASINFEAQKTPKEENEGRAHRVRRLDANIVPLPVIEVWLNIESTESKACIEYQRIFDHLKSSTTEDIAQADANQTNNAWQLGDVKIEMRTTPNKGCTISYSLASHNSPSSIQPHNPGQ